MFPNSTFIPCFESFGFFVKIVYNKVSHKSFSVSIESAELMDRVESSLISS